MFTQIGRLSAERITTSISRNLQVSHTHTRIFFQLDEIQDEVCDGSFSLRDHEPYVEAANTKISQHRKAGGESFKLNYFHDRRWVQINGRMNGCTTKDLFILWFISLLI